MMAGNDMKAPGDEPRPDLSKAAALYEYHREILRVVLGRLRLEDGLYRYYAALGAKEIEALYYFYACDDCGVVGANYDQT